MGILTRLNNLLKRKIEKKKLVIAQQNAMQKQVDEDYKMYLLMIEKKSGLSRKQRELLEARIKAYIALGYIELIDDTDEKETDQD